MNSNQFLTLLQKGNDLQKEDFQQLVKLHASFPYFQIPAVLAAKYENQYSKDGSSELLHKAAILSPDRSWLKSLVENKIDFLEDKENELTAEGSPSVVIIDSQKDPDSSEILNKEQIENLPSEVQEDEPEKEKEQTSTPEDQENKSRTESDVDKNNTSNQDTEPLVSDIPPIDLEELNEKIEFPEEDMTIEDIPPLKTSEEETGKDHKDIITPSDSGDEPSQSLITTPSGGNEDTKPDLILPDSVENPDKADHKEADGNLELNKPEGEKDKPIIAPVPSPSSSRQDILKQLEDNLAKLKSESSKNKSSEDDEEEQDTPKPRRKRSGEDLIDSIKKKEKREIKDNKKKEQNDIIKAFNKKSIKMAAIKENEDVNKLQDLSLPSTKINDRMVSESYAKLLTQQGKKAAAKEIYKKLILKFPQKKAYFADLIQQLEE